jgi:hypothetical protein
MKVRWKSIPFFLTLCLGVGNLKLWEEHLWSCQNCYSMGIVGLAEVFG